MKVRACLLTAFCLLSLAGCASSSLGRSNDDPSLRHSAADIYLRKGVEYMERGNYQVAQQDLLKAIALDETNSEAHDALGVLAERLEQPEEANRHFKRALMLDPQNLAAHNNYARFLCGRGQHAEALSHFRQVIDSKLYAHPEVALTNAGLCAESDGDTHVAEQYLRKALSRSPVFAPALLGMARISQSTGQHLSARAFLQRYLEVAEPDSDVLRLGMVIESSLGNAEAAEAYGRRLNARLPGEDGRP